jgi:hypothetical protein
MKITLLILSLLLVVSASAQTYTMTGTYICSPSGATPVVKFVSFQCGAIPLGGTDAFGVIGANSDMNLKVSGIETFGNVTLAPTGNLPATFSFAFTLSDGRTGTATVTWTPYHYGRWYYPRLTAFTATVN